MKRLASAGGNYSPPYHQPGEVKVWDAATGQELLTLKGSALVARSVAFSPDGKRLASAPFLPLSCRIEIATRTPIVTLRS